MRIGRFFVIIPVAASLVACTARVVVEQPKPLDININITGHLYLVIQDARQNLEQITGEKPANVVRPEDIGLPPATDPGGAALPMNMPPSVPAYAQWDEMETFPIIQATEQDLTKSMAARNAKIQALWAEGIVGESHTGMLAPRAATLTADQQQLVNAENADRTALYAAEAQRRKLKVDEVALGYYVARLGYAKKGAWYEVRNASGQWEWKRWER